MQKAKLNGSLLKLIIFFMIALIGGAIGGWFVGRVTNTNQPAVQITPISQANQVTRSVEENQAAVVSVVNLKVGDTGLVPEEQIQVQQSGEGSGVLYKKETKLAYIVTNQHVVDGADALEVILKNGQRVPATLVGEDQLTDLAVLTIEVAPVTDIAKFGDSSKLKAGQTAIAIGSPLGSKFATSVTKGIISATERILRVPTETNGIVESVVIQTDAAINPGNSGGALLDINGEVIGINTMKLSGENIEGMGFAIPSNFVQEIIGQLEKNGQVIRPVLGVSLKEVSSLSLTQRTEGVNLPRELTSGLVILNIAENSVAAKAGLEPLDTIVKIDGQAVGTVLDFQRELFKHRVGDQVKLEFYRQGQLQNVTVTL